MKRYLIPILIVISVLASGLLTACGTSSPAADFTADPTQGTAPLIVQFTDLSEGDVASWQWDFGDGQASIMQNPSHTYTSEGNYTVSLTIKGAGGSDTETKANYIKVSSPSGEGIICWKDAGKYIGQYKTVEGKIVKTYYAKTSKGQPTFLNFHDPYKGYFTALIWGSDRPKFPPNPESYYLNKIVQVTGLIESYKGAPEIILRDPSQIKVIEKPTISDC